MIQGVPYDAEIEYIRTTGNEYILTDVIPDSTIKIEGSFRWRTINAQARLFGSNSGGTNAIEYSLYRGANNISARGGNTSSTPTFFAGSNGTVYTFSYTATSATINGTTKSIGTPHPAGLYPFALFGRNNLGTVYYSDYPMICDLYWMKFWLGSTLVANFIPVRVATEGFLYDRVSGKLFGNMGTGSFVLGQDIAIPIKSIRLGPDVVQSKFWLPMPGKIMRGGGNG